jgi:CHASE2 domain-containing sensor protein
MSQEGIETSTAAEEPPPKSLKRRIYELSIRIAAALFSTLLLIVAENKFENSPSGQLAESAVHDWTQTFARGTNDSPKVQVIDISDLATTSKGSMVADRSGALLPVTSRPELRTLIASVAANQPLTIGIDVDFSNPDPDLPNATDDKDFFAYLKSLGTPVTLGVLSSTWSSARKPLAFDDVPAAGWIGLQNDWPGLVAEKYEAPDRTTIKSFSESLAEQSGIKPPSPGFLVSFLQSSGLIEDHVLRPLEGQGQVWSRPIDFTALSQHEQRVLDYLPSNPDAVSSAKQLIRGHIILLGNVRAASDKFIAYGRKVIPGVFVHAAAIESALGNRRYRVSDAGNLWVDILVAVASFGIVLYLDKMLSRKKKRLHEGKVSKKLSFAWAGLVLVLALITNLSGIEWLSFDVILVCAFLHPQIDHWVSQGLEGEWVRKWREPRKPFVERMIDDISEEEKE